MACFICQKVPHVFMACEGTGAAAGEIAGVWKKVYNLTKWGLDPDIEEAEAIVTSETNQQRVKPCSDTLEWSLSCRAALCATAGQWLYQFLLNTPNNPSDTRKAFFYTTWDATVTEGTLTTDFPAASTPTYANYADTKGVLLLGTVTPGGFEIDAANAGQASETEFTVEIQSGPFFPAFAALSCPFV